MTTSLVDHVSDRAATVESGEATSVPSAVDANANAVTTSAGTKPRRGRLRTYDQVHRVRPAR
jgi:hypothetical protein